MLQYSTYLLFWGVGTSDSVDPVNLGVGSAVVEGSCRRRAIAEAGRSLLTSGTGVLEPWVAGRLDKLVDSEIGTTHW